MYVLRGGEGGYGCLGEDEGVGAQTTYARRKRGDFDVIRLV
jgi:hypothetical protein